jgi:hypothetical protein
MIVPSYGVILPTEVIRQNWGFALPPIRPLPLSWRARAMLDASGVRRAFNPPIGTQWKR